MGRKKQAPEESTKRLLILKRAEKMFMTQAYGAVSMDALAEAVPVSKRTLYNHFKDKQSLFTAVMQTRCQLLFQKFQEALKENRTPTETLAHIGQQFLDVALEPDAINIYRTAISEAAHFPDLGLLFYESGPKRSQAVLSSYLKKLHDKGELKVPNPELAAGIFMSMLKGPIHTQRLLGVRKKVSKKEKEEIIRTAVDIFLHGHTPGVPTTFF